jgi:D-alanyl-D-alanine carboxypeptidase
MTGGRILLATLVAVAMLPSVAAAGTGEDLDAALDQVVAAPQGPPGLSVLISRDGEAEYRQRGIGDLATGAAPARDEHARIASMAKAFSGGVALSLVAKGKLELDDTVGELLPRLLPRARKVTLAQALAHTAGLPDYIRDKRFIKVLLRDPSRYMGPRGLLSYVRDEPLLFKPGSRYEYSDTDNIVVALMAQKATGRSYNQLLARNVYRPLGLTNTSLPGHLRMPSPYLHGYEVSPGGPPEDVTELINPALAWASGGIVSTVDDVSGFFRGYLGGELFDRRTRRAQHHFVKGSSSPPGPGRNSAGLGVFRYRTGCGTVFGHTGSFPGYRLFAASTRDGSGSVAFFVNAQIVPGQGSAEVSDLIRRAQERAVCHLLRD